MNKTFKRFLSVILCAVMLFTISSVAFAAEDNAEVLEKSFTCDYYLRLDKVVVTFNSEYTEIGETPKVTVYSREQNSETVNVTVVDKDKVYMEIFEHNGVRYPQLFVDVSFCWTVLAVEVGEGAFIRANGEKSAKVEISNSRIKDRYKDGFDVECEGEVYWLYENLLDISNMESYCYATVGKPIKVNVSIEGNHADAWREKAVVTYTVNGKTVEINSDEFTPEEAGEYIIQIQLNDMIRKFSFEVKDEKTSYFEGVGMAGKVLLVSPLEFFFGLFAFFFAPGFGTIGGPGFMLDAFRNIGRFVMAIFTGPEYFDHTFGLKY